IMVCPPRLFLPSACTIRLSSLSPLLFVFTAPAPAEIYTLSLHDALPIWRAKGLAAQSSCLTAAQEWHVIFDGCFYVANCPSLRLTTMSETYDELPEMISDILQHLLRGLLRSGELETFLQKHGWEKRGPANWRNYAMPRPSRLYGEINRLRILVSDLLKANGDRG